MSIYGEGLGHTEAGVSVEPTDRSLDELRRGRWEPKGPDGEPLTPLPTCVTTPAASCPNK